LSDGLRFVDRAFLDEVLQAGLDHLMLILQPENELSWQAVGNALVEDLSVTVHLTITEQNKDKATEILVRLSAAGVNKISLSAMDTSLVDALKNRREQAAALGFELVWNLPVPYSALHPVALETGDALIEGAGRAWLYIEPDGDVRPTQGDPKLLGNLLNDPWTTIWKS
jgi:MoaA/NifB/PqqE/SkfB family radical SAM enzyme